MCVSLIITERKGLVNKTKRPLVIVNHVHVFLFVRTFSCRCCSLLKFVCLLFSFLFCCLLDSDLYRTCPLC